MRLRLLVKLILLYVCIIWRCRALTMGVRDYRMDMVDKVGLNLYEIWREAVDAYFHKED